MTEQFYQIERRIEIDAGHRVPHHGSQCRNLHGHRYKIGAVCRGPLTALGEQQGMVLDFGFLKEEMMREIHAPCDHALILWLEDALAREFIGDAARFDAEIRPQVAAQGYYPAKASRVGALYLMKEVPTAENLAAHWFIRLQGRVLERSERRAHLYQIIVYETPHCMAAYPAY